MAHEEVGLVTLAVREGARDPNFDLRPSTYQPQMDACLSRRRSSCGIVTLALLAAACSGAVDGNGGPPGTAGPGTTTGTSMGAPPRATDVGPSGARRLTRFEYDNTLRDLLGDTSRSGSTTLPDDPKTPYDNDATNQSPSSVLISALESLAEQAADRVLADPRARSTLVPCQPSGPADAACMRQFIVSFGRRALRRPLTDAEVDRFLGLQAYASETGDFYFAVGLVVRAILQEPEFIYRIERGTAVSSDGRLRQLDSFEIATRMSYFLLQTTPPDALLDRAQAGELQTPEQRRAAALTLFGDARVSATVDRFHALWLGYISLPHPPELASAMQQETQALVERVVIDQNSDYLDIFRATDTYANATLAQNYGLAPPASSGFGWIPYGSSGRRGILSQGSILSAYAKFDDTSFTQRGLYVRRRLMCQDIPPPPPNVDVNQPLSLGGPCKQDKQRAHAAAGCASCHDLMDPIGYGLESYDRLGRLRTHEDNAPSCAITGDGEVVGVGKFNGPAALSDLLLSGGFLQSCVAEQVYRFAAGRPIDDKDADELVQIKYGFDQGQRRFSELLVSVVASDGFALFRQKE